MYVWKKFYTFNMQSGCSSIIIYQPFHSSYFVYGLKYCESLDQHSLPLPCYLSQIVMRCLPGESNAERSYSCGAPKLISDLFYYHQPKQLFPNGTFLKKCYVFFTPRRQECILLSDTMQLLYNTLLAVTKKEL